jgi:hypothetical protein
MSAQNSDGGGGCLAALVAALMLLWMIDWTVNPVAISCTVNGRGFTEAQLDGGEPLVLVYLHGRLHGCVATEPEWRGLAAGAAVRVLASRGRLSHHLYECVTQAKAAERLRENRR